MATPIDKCHAAYVQCIGVNPTPLRQVECTFRYAQCILGQAQIMLAKELKRAGLKKPKKPRKGK